MKRKNRKTKYTDICLLPKDDALKTSKFFNLTTMQWEIHKVEIASEQYPIKIDKLIAYVRKAQPYSVSVKVSIPLNLVTSRKQSIKLNGGSDTEISVSQSTIEGDCTKDVNYEEKDFEELITATKDCSFDIESQSTSENVKTQQMYDYDRFIISNEETLKLRNDTSPKPSTFNSSGSTLAKSMVELTDSDEDKFEIHVETKVKNDKHKVIDIIQRLEDRKEIIEHSENSDSEILSMPVCVPDKLTEIEKCVSESTLVEDELDYEPSNEKECQATCKLSSVENSNGLLQTDEICTQNIPTNTLYVQNRLKEKDKNVTSPKTSLNLSASSDEIELEPDTNDILYEECNRKSPLPQQSNEEKVKIAIVQTTEPEEKQTFLEYVKSCLSQGNLKKALELIKHTTEHCFIGEALQLVLSASEKLPEIIKFTFFVYKNVFKHIRPWSVHSNIVNKLFLTSKGNSELRHMYSNLLEFVQSKKPPLVVPYYTCEVLLELMVSHAAWPTVIKILNYSLIICRNKPHVKYINLVLQVAHAVPNLSHIIFNILVKSSTRDQRFLSHIDPNNLENFYQLLKKYNKNDDAEKLWAIISPHWNSSSVIPLFRSFGGQDLIQTNAVLQNFSTSPLILLNTCTRLDNKILVNKAIVSENWKELSIFFNQAIEFTDRDIFIHVFCALRNHTYPSQAFVQLLSVMTWRPLGDVMYSRQVTLLGQIGTSLFLDCCYEQQYQAAMCILASLHKFNINYYNLQKNIAVCDFLHSMVISANEVALMAVKAAIHIENPFIAIQILNDCNWIGLSTNEFSSVAQEELNQLEEILLALIELIVQTLSCEMLQNSLNLTIELLSTGLKVLVLFSKIYSIKANTEDLFNKYYAFLLNMEMYAECIEMDNVFQTPQPNLQRGLLLLLNKNQKNTKYLLHQLLLEGVYLKNNVQERIITLRSYYTNSEFELLLVDFFDRLFNAICKNINGNYSYVVQIILEYCHVNLDNHFGIKSLLSSFDLDSSLNRLRDVLEQFDLKISSVDTDITKYRIVITSSSVYQYLNKNFRHLSKSLPPLLVSQSQSLGGFETLNQRKIGVIKGIKKLDSPNAKITQLKPCRALSRPSSALKRHFGDKQSVYIRIKNKAILGGQKNKFQQKNLKACANRYQTPASIPITPPLDPPNLISKTLTSPLKLSFTCQIPQTVRMKIDNFLKSKLSFAGKNPDQSKHLMKAFIHFIVKTFNVSSIPALNASLLKELNKFASEKIKP